MGGTDMPEFDVAEFKRALSAEKGTRREHSQLLREAEISEGSQKLKNRQAIGQVLQPFLTQAGLDVDNLNKVLAQNQKALRSNFQQRKVAAAKYSSSEGDALLHALELGRKSLEHLATRPPALDAGLSSLLTLPRPLLVWEWNPLGQLKDYVIQPLNSYAKILVDIPVYGFDNNSGSDENEISFFFFWTNSTGYVSIVNAFSVLSLDGACELAANYGFFSGDTMTLSLDAWLYPLELWRSIPPGGNMKSLRVQGDPLQHQSVLDHFTAAGGGQIFGGGADYENKIFSTIPYGLSYGSYGGLSVPPGATAGFEVDLTINYSWNGNTLPDEITADFADDNLHYYVGCPLVVLEFLTAPPSMASVQPSSTTAKTAGRARKKKQRPRRGK
jgi:hypothetical protein